MYLGVTFTFSLRLKYLAIGSQMPCSYWPTSVGVIIISADAQVNW